MQIDFAEVAKRKLVYIKIANKELVKKSAGTSFNQDLINACQFVVDQLAIISKHEKLFKEAKKAI